MDRRLKYVLISLLVLAPCCWTPWFSAGDAASHLSDAMLAYGWVFHMGFFNFYLSMGLCFWAMRLAWDLSPRRGAAAGGLLVLAYAAHALPVVWTVAVVGYFLVARRLSGLGRAYLTAA